MGPIGKEQREIEAEDFSTTDRGALGVEGSGYSGSTCRRFRAFKLQVYKIQEDPFVSDFDMGNRLQRSWTRRFSLFRTLRSFRVTTVGISLFRGFRVEDVGLATWAAGAEGFSSLLFSHRDEARKLYT